MAQHPSRLLIHRGTAYNSKPYSLNSALDSVSSVRDIAAADEEKDLHYVSRQSF
jgi:hypothetical protein